MFSGLTAQLDPTRNPADGQVLLPFFDYVDYVNADDVAIYYGMATTDHPVYVIEVIHHVKTAFGGSATIDVGDGTTADKYIANSGIDENSAGNLVSSAVRTVYIAPFQVKVTLGGTRTGGTGRLIVGMLRL
jgi:hypothetical protein